MICCSIFTLGNLHASVKMKARHTKQKLESYWRMHDAVLIHGGFYSVIHRVMQIFNKIFVDISISHEQINGFVMTIHRVLQRTNRCLLVFMWLLRYGPKSLITRANSFDTLQHMWYLPNYSYNTLCNLMHSTSNSFWFITRMLDTLA